MDLSTLDTTDAANAGAEMELCGPDGAPVTQSDGSPVTITLLGKDSDVFVRETNANSNRFLNQRGRVKTSAESLRAEGTRLLAKCTVAWSGVVVDGETLPCNFENALKLYNRFAFIREQVDEFIGERANFTKASPKA